MAYRRLGLLEIHLIRLQRQQPGQVQQPQVPGGEFGPGLHHGRELAARLVPVVVCIFLVDVQIEDQVAVGLDERRGVRGTVLPGRFRIQHAVRQPRLGVGGDGRSLGRVSHVPSHECPYSAPPDRALRDRPPLKGR